jgi:hypothetical protein
MNHQNFDNPNLNIDSTGNAALNTPIVGNNVPFGRITNTLGNRSFVINTRLNF